MVVDGQDSHRPSWRRVCHVELETASSRQSVVATVKKARRAPAVTGGSGAPKHLAASMRVARSELGPAHTTIAATRDLIRRVAAEARSDAAGAANLALVGRFERVTGVAIEELEQFSADWPTE